MSNENLRDMGGKPITNTYKGILRIANNIDLENASKDYFNSEIYYSLDWSGEGDNNTKNYFDSESNIRRFRTNDKYTNLKLPVTDSCGNYMGFSLGTDSTLIGPGIFKDNESLKNNFIAVDIPTNIISVGKENRKEPSKKSNKGGDIIIEGNGATLYFENNEHISEIKNSPDENDKIFKTIFSINREPIQYDTFIFHQNNVEKYDDGSYGCKIELENLQDYVNKEINEYFTSNICGLPTGTIVSQYCSLKKWFCWDGSASNDTSPEWMGYRPSMYTSNQSMYSYFNVLQNTALLKNTLLYYSGNNSNAFVNETAPDFKKGYALCNGGRIDINLRPSYLQGITNEKLSFDLFFDLFYTIGYYYHTNKEGLYFHNVKTIKENNETKYELEHIKSENRSLDSEILYGMSMAAMIVFKALDKRFSLNDNIYPNGTLDERIQQVKEYLAALTFPDEYVFNIVEKDFDNSPLYYNYKGRLEKNETKNILINIGIPIDSYKSLMPYYYVKNGKINKGYTKLYNLPIIEYMIRLFLEREELGWSNFVYQFYLPKLFTTTDTEVNDAGIYKGLYGAHQGLAVGQFIGSSGISVCESYTDNSGNNIETASQLYQPFNCYFNLNTGVLAHSHAIAKSPETITKYELLENFKISDTRGLLKLARSGASNNIISGADSNDVIPGACFRGNYVGYRDQLSNDIMDSYVLQEIIIFKEGKICEFNDLKEMVYDKNTMTAGYQVNNSKDGTSFKWYGKTSEPLWTKNTSLTSFTKKFNQPDNIGYFCPESVNTLPLIKL